uniref:Phosphatidylinositol specific phospholipase C X domain containing 1 n=1 Tax=Latimeria chalumnae TaxID=7897 RepID=H3AXN3_LATCH
RSYCFSLRQSFVSCTAGGTQKSDWMSHLPEKLWDIPLYNLAIPGSHNTMTYCLDNDSPIDESEPEILQILDTYLPCIVRPFLSKWCPTQGSTITEQLDAGIRFLDLRIAHKPKDLSKGLYFVHGIFTTVTVQETLQDIARWLKTHPKEIIILDCKHFQGMDKELHKHLIQSIKNIFGFRICPKTENPTLRNLWKSSYQVIVSYENIIAVKYDELWPAVPYWWANTSDPQALVQYLEKQKERGRPGHFFVAGINLTEDLFYILSHPFGSLKNLTLSNSPQLMDWVKRQLPGRAPQCVSIIAGDFTEAYHLAAAIIALNGKLL